MTPQDARTIADFLIGNLEMEIGTTVNVFNAVPPDRQAYRPDATTRSAIDLLRHITVEDEWLLQSVIDGAFTPPPDDSEKCGVMNASDAVARYQARMSALIATLRAMPGDAYLKMLEFGPMKMPAIQVLAMTLRHSAHHRGQLSTYLRSMGARVPAIYGPSGDVRWDS